MELFLFLLTPIIVTVDVGKVMSTIVPDHRLPRTRDLHFKLYNEVDYLPFVRLVKVPLSGVLS